MDVIQILRTNNLDNTLNLLGNIGDQGIYNITKLTSNETINNGFIELTVLVGENVDKVNKSVDNLGGKFENLGYGFGIITFKSEEISKINRVDGVIYVEVPKLLFTTNLESNRASCIPRLNESKGLLGKGVYVGFIDTGIDYTHSGFKDLNGETRIKYIYDLSSLGKVYTSNDINNALKEPDPFKVLDCNDSTGHGTHVAGIACAGGNIDKFNYGVAPLSEIIMVKTVRGGKINYTLSTQIMRGIRFIVNKSREDNKPAVINLSMSTNDGAHNGSSLLEQYVDVVSKSERISIVVAAGNEGESSHHVGREITDVDQEIPIQISKGEKNIVIQLYKPILSDIRMNIISPTFKESGFVDITEGLKKISIESNRIYFFMSGAKPFDINGEVSITILNQVEFITDGEWKIVIRPVNNYKGRFDMWLPISEGLNPNTKFLKPDIMNTLGIPATTEGVIAVGSYNFRSNTLSAFSGRGGSSSYNYIKPELLAPGENILSTIKGGEFDTLSGTSMAAPQVAGICALFLEWGIVNLNDPFLFGERLKSYLIKGATRDRIDVIYPNYSFGYGEVCAFKSFEIISIIKAENRSAQNKLNREMFISNTYDLEDEFIMYSVNGLEIRIPK